MNLIIPRPDVDGAVLLLSFADDQDEIVLRQLIVSNLLIEGAGVRGVSDNDKAGPMELLTDLFSVVVENGVHRNDGGLTWESQNGHLPPVCSVRMAIMRSTEPRMA